MSPTELTLADFDYTFDDPFLRAAFAQESFKFRYQRKDPYIRVKWWFIIVNDPFSRSVPPRKVSQFKLGERWSEPIGANFIVKVDIHRLVGLSLAVIPEWVESRLTFQDKKAISQIQESFLGFESVRSFARSLQQYAEQTGKSIETCDMELAAGMKLMENDWTALIVESVKSGDAPSDTATSIETRVWGSIVYSLRR